MEPENDVDKYAVAVINEDRITWHSMKGKKETLAKTVFFFLRLDATNSGKVTINRKAVNKGKGNGIEVPFTIPFTGTDQILNELK